MRKVEVENMTREITVEYISLTSEAGEEIVFLAGHYNKKARA